MYGIRGGDKSFFGDVLDAKITGQYIKTRDNDDFVISYSNIGDITGIIKYVIFNRINDIVNITTNSFNSRANIKALVNNTKVNSINHNLGHRIISNVVNWETIISKRKELFENSLFYRKQSRILSFKAFV